MVHLAGMFGMYVENAKVELGTAYTGFWTENGVEL